MHSHHVRRQKIIALLAFLFIGFLPATAQFTLNILIKDLPAKHPDDTVFVAGSFNNWTAGNSNYRFVSNGTQAVFQLSDLDSGLYQFKFTRGGWENVEVASSGGDVANHVVRLTSDTSLEYSIGAWKDDLGTMVKPHTASINVQVIDSAFKLPQLNRTRRIWIYLPPGYKKGRQRYPVIYMQDGQNLFDANTSAFGEWNVDESLDSLIADGEPPCIVVGIDNGPRRLNEYNPYEFKEHGAGEGDQYVDFIVKTLKPFIDKRYRTNRNKENTVIAGSSMGGLIAYYAMLKYPKVFGNAGIFSPAFWTAEAIKQATIDKADSLNGKFFFYMGGLEGENYLKDMETVTTNLGEHSQALVYSVVDPDAAHNETAWRKWFPEFYKWILANGFNEVINMEKN